MATALERFQDETSLLMLDDSLLFLNRLLAASREEGSDPAFEPILKARKAGVPTFFVRFLAKQLLQHANNLGINQMTGDRFLWLMDMYFKLDDPISSDPDWPTADPSGFFERMAAQQIAPQRQHLLQQIGLGLGLFRDVGPVRTDDSPAYDLRQDIETELGMSVEEFMAMGLLCSSADQATYHGRRCSGTFNQVLISQLNALGQGAFRPEVLSLFLARVAADRDTFRVVCSDRICRVQDVRYTQFEFNRLVRFPVTHLGNGRYLAVDPHLLTERTTLGLFYDLFARDGIEFSKRFGYAFDRFVGNLLQSVYPPSTLWWEAQPGRSKPKNPGQVADWAYQGENHLVLLECKSLRPNLNLVTYGTEEHLLKLRERIVKAVKQLTNHAEAIREGKWAAHGLPTTEAAVGIVVSYGHIHTANGPFMRERVRKLLAEMGIEPIPYVVLSVEDLDYVIRLAEFGQPLDQVVATLAASEGSFNLLGRYASVFQGQQQISTFTHGRATEFFDKLVTIQTVGQDRSVA